MKLVQLLNCLRGRHERSRGSAWQDGAVFRSKCRGCGKPMIRTPGGWSVEISRDAESVAAEQ